MEPLISVILPAYNADKTIGRAIKSVLDQTYKRFELLVIDDSSTDNTAEVAESLMKTDSRIIVIRNKKNLGVAQTRNVGCRKSRGDYLTFLDSDDVWFEDKLEKQISFMQSTGCDLSCTAYSLVKPDEEPSKTERIYMVPESITYETLLKENVIGCSTVMIRAEFMKKHEFNGTFAHEDYALWLDLAKSGKTLCGLNEVLTAYFYGGRSSNKLKAAMDRWVIYRQSQKLTFCKSLYYMIFYFFNALKKYRKFID